MKKFILILISIILVVLGIFLFAMLNARNKNAVLGDLNAKYPYFAEEKTDGLQISIKGNVNWTVKGDAENAISAELLKKKLGKSVFYIKGNDITGFSKIYFTKENDYQIVFDCYFNTDKSIKVCSFSSNNIEHFVKNGNAEQYSWNIDISGDTAMLTLKSMEDYNWQFENSPYIEKLLPTTLETGENSYDFQISKGFYGERTFRFFAKGLKTALDLTLSENLEFISANAIDFIYDEEETIKNSILENFGERAILSEYDPKNFSIGSNITKDGLSYEYASYELSIKGKVWQYTIGKNISMEEFAPLQWNNAEAFNSQSYIILTDEDAIILYQKEEKVYRLNHKLKFVKNSDGSESLEQISKEDLKEIANIFIKII